MNEPLPTVAIQHPTLEGEWMLINQQDFDPALHVLFGAMPTDPAEIRTQELQGLYAQDGWMAIKAIATPLGIEKPETGWDAAIPLIVAAEFEGHDAP
jgi:hypothetical protein